MIDHELSVEPRGRNAIIHGDNLTALERYADKLRGRIRCAYLDPPYNSTTWTRSYMDKRPVDEWIDFMRPRLAATWNTISDDGSIWISIDDKLVHHLRILMEEVVSAKSYLATIVWERRHGRHNSATVSINHEYLLIYVKNRAKFKAGMNRLPLDDGYVRKAYRNPNDDPRGPWCMDDIINPHFRPSMIYEIVAPSGKKWLPPNGRGWKFTRVNYERYLAEDRIHFGADGNSMPRLKRFLKDNKGLVPSTMWPCAEVGHSQEAANEMAALFGSTKTFDTPKPERLLHRILHISTKPGDMVLDPFAGSGTTAAVAHKMRRNWIAIESEGHARTLVLERMRKVIDGEWGGISGAVGWAGGGGLSFVDLTMN